MTEHAHSRSPLESTAPLIVTDWGLMDYREALQGQHELVAERIAGRRPDHLVFVEHPPTVTLGRSGAETDLCVSGEALARQGIALHRIERGGRATFHNPGQMVAYPIIELNPRDLHLYLERLLDTVAQVVRLFGLHPELKKGRPGIWVRGAKIASVGIAVRKWVSYHGVALNVSNDIDGFRWIVPCGESGEKITSLALQTGEAVDLSRVKAAFEASFRRTFGYEAPSGRRGRHPGWLVRPLPDLKAVERMENRLRDFQLATVCQSAHCPNLGECFARGTATFMILGTRCTRRCRFCAVDKGPPEAVDPAEPRRVAQAARRLGLEHVVVTSVTRDDLPDGGSRQFAATIREIREACPGVRVEVLVPDFQGSPGALDTVCDARPDVFNHNVETVPRLYEKVRPGADYRRSLAVLAYAARKGLWAKSGLMLGLGEDEEEVRRVLRNLREVGCRCVTLGQYLAPSGAHAPVARYVSPGEFDEWAQAARSMGFESVASAPLVRSSYRAGEMPASASPPQKTGGS